MRNALVLTSLVAAAVLCFGAAGRMAGRPATMASPESSMPGLSSEIPPGVRFVMVALGGFRGLLADALWVRAAGLQDEGRVFEVAQLTEWITRLEPRSPEVWSYHAWNLAYNIAALFPDPEDRWRWVKNGIRLLRDEGIPANPRDPRLYWELGWLYADKVAGRWDPAQLHYRVSLAHEMTGLTEGGRFDAGAVQGRAEVAARFLAVGLLPDAMAQADEAYGPLDWRLPESHALYWGMRGRPFQKADSRWCDRLVWSALIEMVRGGSLYFDPVGRLYLRGPRLDIAIKGVRRCERENVLVAPLTVMVGDQFLRESMMWLSVFGHKAEAEEALAVLRRVPDSDVGDQDVEAVLRKELSLRFQGVNRTTGESLVEGMLVRGYMWTALDNSEVGAGFVRLAKLHWGVLMSLLGTGESDMEERGWRELCRRAHEQAARELPKAGDATAGGHL